LFFTERFADEWYMARTPGYPLLLRGAFELLGMNTEVVELLNAVFLAGAVHIVVFLSLKFFGVGSAVVVSILGSFHPFLIGLSHNVLTEIGTAFFLTLILLAVVHSVTSKDSFGARHVVLLAGSIAVGYYFRQTLLYLLIPALFSLWVCRFRRPDSLPRLLVGSIAVVLALMVFISPWKNFGEDSQFKDVVLIYGLVKQWVIPPESPLVAPVRDVYSSGIEDAFSSGLRRVSGVPAPAVKEVATSLKKNPAADPLEIILQNPLRYLKGVVRSFLYFSGLPGMESQNYLWSSIALTRGSTKVTGKHPEYSAKFTSLTPPAALSQMLFSLVRFYIYLIPLAVMASAFLWLRAVLQRDGPLLSITSFSLFFLAIHSATCFTVDRYVLPVHLLLLCALSVALVAFFHTLWGCLPSRLRRL
jgi:4-amino-4-deoxy-L-arabinose transferase-like glycosyltransferase